MPATETQVFSDLSISFRLQGIGRPILVLHGGGGPATVTSLADHLAQAGEVIVPTHPGWNGTARPPWLDSIDEVAMLYLRLLAQRGLKDVLVVGSSVGGWIAMQMAFRDHGGLVGRLVLIDAAGIDVAEHPMVDFFALDPRGIAEHSYHEPEKFFVDPASLPAERVAAVRANIATLRALAGAPYMHDPKLRLRLRDIGNPALVLWGESDRVFTPGYGRALADGLRNARFALIEGAGHLPQIEQPAQTFAAIDAFLAEASLS
ncbi:alpha/beta fold hydrolase [Devosia sp.]|uniref:alpha/beta fold hydrolase n=1 Tax=Devosia sp. TaxID=1871048 RepID=UPI003BA98B9B